MAITLVPEDGTGLANANTYADATFAAAFAETLDLTLPTDAQELASVLLQAMPYLESQPWQGQRATTVQALAWPRKLVIINGVELSASVVPTPIKQAQVVAASMINAGIDLLPTISGQVVTKEKVGPIETEYSDQYLGTWNGQSIFASIDIYLQPFLNLVGGYRLSSRFGF